MIKHVRTALAALLVAFAIAFGLGPLDSVFGISSTPSVLAASDAKRIFLPAEGAVP